ncbi:uncharacterized protein BX663DRAFT_119636 [Cokeromyces recurvatus]|uniref:uncharacterized protein n=1 Tax=Cokeromyces recurvatus TaxID=90255 RepID=UPI002220778C|nr:uncharacterized protein BX663DRAFT_119636 [Cokeromyces recurvatus]KAI7906856.1 hypothetical protein BX663DRAFT_119636 [Cokeromyces recurvatus]
MSQKKRFYTSHNVIKSKDLILDSDEDDSDNSDLDILDLTILKLERLMDQGQYKEARILFNEMIKSTLFSTKDLWKIGIEIVTNTTPEDVVDYIRALHASCQEDLKFDTFNAFIDQLMLEKKWEMALNEIDL